MKYARSRTTTNYIHMLCQHNMRVALHRIIHHEYTNTTILKVLICHVMHTSSVFRDMRRNEKGEYYHHHEDPVAAERIECEKKDLKKFVLSELRPRYNSLIVQYETNRVDYFSDSNDDSEEEDGAGFNLDPYETLFY